MESIKINDEGRITLRRSIVRSSHNGRFYIFGSSFEAEDEALAWAIEYCRRNRRPPLSALHDYNVQQARERELRLKNIRENVATPEQWAKLTETREYLQRVGKDRIREMGRRLSWKEET
jgi:hypothetical protein